MMPPALLWIEPIINFFNRFQIRKFTRCWVPDFPNGRITEKLSESKGLNVEYIGMLSRFNPAIVLDRPKKYEFLAILSGPEPQRTQFEKILVSQFLLSGKRCLLVRGLPNEVKETTQGQLEIVNYLPSDKLQEAIEDSDIVICRSGYSSIMDFARLAGRVIFVPTPGQTEQEYLAEQLKVKRIAFYQKQEEFDLSFAITNSVNYRGFTNQNFSTELLNKTLDNLLK
jgi:UDP-N-acetylglucosamine transferase subunit ALG13